MRQPIEVVEVGLRDGLQMLPQVVPTADKLTWLRAEASSGLHRFEVGSFVPPKLMPQMADAAEVVGAARAMPGLHIAVLAPNLKGATAAMEAGAHVIVMPVSASEAHCRANVRKTPDEMVAELARVCALRRETGHGVKIEAGLATAFGCTLQGEVPESEVVRLAVACAEAGADCIGLGDTVGYATPAQVRHLFRAVRDAVGEIAGSAHFHDTRGTGLANVVAALDVGIRNFDASLGGLGGCPHAPGASGNIATEDLVFMLESMGFDTGVDLARLIEAQRVLATLLPNETLHGKIAGAGMPRTFAA
ncbi:hydroxymethylglutaryl-CoA lyase [Humitalea sp. 24SJ18S-53]|uniref:hydroxymethylglutaryl-CoA lyase n=1 Tax=Humitalea sp. 24SJ18S-53 TaxID=3422307 RepID=UPI003D67CC09